MEFSEETGRIKCWICRCYFSRLKEKRALISKNQDAFASVGHQDNKHALDAFGKHENSDGHLRCMELHALQVSKQQNINVQLNQRIKTKQELNRKHFLKVVKCTQCLAKQNIAFRGHEVERSNFYNLMKLMDEIDPVDHDLPHEHTSWKIQNELTCLMGNDVKNRNLDRIRKNGYFGVSGDETADVQNNSIFSIIYRTVDMHLEVDEVFSGFYVLGDKKSVTIANLMLVSIYLMSLQFQQCVINFILVIQDLMINKDKLNPVKKCAAQGYDGSNNMMGVKAGVAVRVKEVCPLATENHCFCHTASLPCKAVYNNIPFMNTFQTQTFEILKLIKKSSQREHPLGQHKKVAPADKMNEEPAKVNKIISWNPVRMTENCKPLDSMKQNYP